MDFSKYKGYNEEYKYKGFQEEEEEEEESDPKLRGGFLAIPLKDEQQATQVVLRFLEHTSDPLIRFLFKENRHVSRQEYIKHYMTNNRVSVRLDNEFPLSVEFGPYRQGYFSIMMEGQSAIFNNLAGKYPPETNDQFFARMKRFIHAWVQVCEAVKADFAFFSSGCCHTTQKWLNECVLDSLNPLNTEDLLLPVFLDYWLTYLGPQLVPHVSDQDLQSLQKQHVKIITLPSGALFLLNHRSPLLLENDALDDAFFEQEVDFNDLASQ